MENNFNQTPTSYEEETLKTTENQPNEAPAETESQQVEATEPTTTEETPKKVSEMTDEEVDTAFDTMVNKEFPAETTASQGGTEVTRTVGDATVKQITADNGDAATGIATGKSIQLGPIHTPETLTEAPKPTEEAQSHEDYQ